MLVDSCRVTATCRNPAAATALEELRQQHGERLEVCQMDVTDFKSIQRCAADVTERCSHLNLLFNVAGVLHIEGETLQSVCV